MVVLVVLEVQEVVLEVAEVVLVVLELVVLEVVQVVVAPQKSFASTSPALWREPPLRW